MIRFELVLYLKRYSQLELVELPALSTYQMCSVCFYSPNREIQWNI